MPIPVGTSSDDGRIYRRKKKKKTEYLNTATGRTHEIKEPSRHGGVPRVSSQITPSTEERVANIIQGYKDATGEEPSLDISTSYMNAGYAYRMNREEWADFFRQVLGSTRPADLLGATGPSDPNAVHVGALAGWNPQSFSEFMRGPGVPEWREQAVTEAGDVVVNPEGRPTYDVPAEAMALRIGKGPTRNTPEERAAKQLKDQTIREVRVVFEDELEADPHVAGGRYAVMLPTLFGYKSMQESLQWKQALKADPSLKKEDPGRWVKALQKHLNKVINKKDMGLDPLKVNGVYDAQTMERYQYLLFMRNAPAMVINAEKTKRGEAFEKETLAGQRALESFVQATGGSWGISYGTNLRRWIIDQYGLKGGAEAGKALDAMKNLLAVNYVASRPPDQTEEEAKAEYVDYFGDEWTPPWMFEEVAAKQNEARLQDTLLGDAIDTGAAAVNAVSGAASYVASKIDYVVPEPLEQPLKDIGKGAATPAILAFKGTMWVWEEAHAYANQAMSSFYWGAWNALGHEWKDTDGKVVKEMSLLGAFAEGWEKAEGKGLADTVFESFGFSPGEHEMAKMLTQFGIDTSIDFGAGKIAKLSGAYKLKDMAKWKTLSKLGQTRLLKPTPMFDDMTMMILKLDDETKIRKLFHIMDPKLERKLAGITPKYHVETGLRGRRKFIFDEPDSEVSSKLDQIRTLLQDHPGVHNAGEVSILKNIRWAHLDRPDLHPFINRLINPVRTDVIADLNKDGFDYAEAMGRATGMTDAEMAPHLKAIMAAEALDDAGDAAAGIWRAVLGMQEHGLNLMKSKKVKRLMEVTDADGGKRLVEKEISELEDAMRELAKVKVRGDMGRFLRAYFPEVRKNELGEYTVKELSEVPVQAVLEAIDSPEARIYAKAMDEMRDAEAALAALRAKTEEQTDLLSQIEAAQLRLDRAQEKARAQAGLVAHSRRKSYDVSGDATLTAVLNKKGPLKGEDPNDLMTHLSQSVTMKVNGKRVQEKIDLRGIVDKRGNLLVAPDEAVSRLLPQMERRYKLAEKKWGPDSTYAKAYRAEYEHFQRLGEALDPDDKLIKRLVDEARKGGAEFDPQDDKIYAKLAHWLDGELDKVNSEYSSVSSTRHMARLTELRRERADLQELVDSMYYLRGENAEEVARRGLSLLKGQPGRTAVLEPALVETYGEAGGKRIIEEMEDTWEMHEADVRAIEKQLDENEAITGHRPEALKNQLYEENLSEAEISRGRPFNQEEFIFDYLSKHHPPAIEVITRGFDKDDFRQLYKRITKLNREIDAAAVPTTPRQRVLRDLIKRYDRDIDRYERGIKLRDMDYEEMAATASTLQRTLDGLADAEGKEEQRAARRARAAARWEDERQQNLASAQAREDELRSELRGAHREESFVDTPVSGLHDRRIARHRPSLWLSEPKQGTVVAHLSHLDEAKTVEDLVRIADAAGIDGEALLALVVKKQPKGRARLTTRSARRTKAFASFKDELQKELRGMSRSQRKLELAQAMLETSPRLQIGDDRVALIMRSVRGKLSDEEHAVLARYMTEFGELDGQRLFLVHYRTNVVARHRASSYQEIADDLGITEFDAARLKMIAEKEDLSAMRQWYRDHDTYDSMEADDSIEEFFADYLSTEANQRKWEIWVNTRTERVERLAEEGGLQELRREFMTEDSSTGIMALDDMGDPIYDEIPRTRFDEYRYERITWSENDAYDRYHQRLDSMDTSRAETYIDEMLETRTPEQRQLFDEELENIASLDDAEVPDLNVLGLEVEKINKEIAETAKATKKNLDPFLSDEEIDDLFAYLEFAARVQAYRAADPSFPSMTFMRGEVLGRVGRFLKQGDRTALERAVMHAKDSHAVLRRQLTAHRLSKMDPLDLTSDEWMLVHKMGMSRDTAYGITRMRAIDETLETLDSHHATLQRVLDGEVPLDENGEAILMVETPKKKIDLGPQRKIAVMVKRWTTLSGEKTQIVAYSSWTPGSGGYIHSNYVSPEFWGTRIGSRMRKFAMENGAPTTGGVATISPATMVLRHKQMVIDAIKSGKSVPLDRLVEYPDLWKLIQRSEDGEVMSILGVVPEMHYAGAAERVPQMEGIFDRVARLEGDLRDTQLEVESLIGAVRRESPSSLQRHTRALDEAADKIASFATFDHRADRLARRLRRAKNDSQRRRVLNEYRAVVDDLKEFSTGHRRSLAKKRYEGALTRRNELQDEAGKIDRMLSGAEHPTEKHAVDRVLKGTEQYRIGLEKRRQELLGYRGLLNEWRLGPGTQTVPARTRKALNEILETNPELGVYYKSGKFKGRLNERETLLRVESFLKRQAQDTGKEQHRLTTLRKRAERQRTKAEEKMLAQAGDLNQLMPKVHEAIANYNRRLLDEAIPEPFWRYQSTQFYKAPFDMRWMLAYNTKLGGRKMAWLADRGIVPEGLHNLPFALEKWNRTRKWWMFGMSPDEFTRAYKNLVLFKLATMIRITMGDEALRMPMEGINPIRAAKMSRYAKEMRKRNKFPEELDDTVSAMLDHLNVSDFRVYTPEESGYGELFIHATRQIRKEPTTPVWRDAVLATGNPEDGFAALVHHLKTDPGAQSFLKRTYRSLVTDADDPSMVAKLEMSEAMLNDYARTMHQFYGRMWSHPDLQEAFFGSAAFDIKRLRKVPTDLLPPLSGRTTRSPLANNWPARFAYGQTRAQEALYGTLDAMSNRMKEILWAHKYDTYMGRMASSVARGVRTEEEAHKLASSLALRDVRALLYNPDPLQVESLARNLVLFMPAYRQFIQYWAKAIARDPIFLVPTIMRAQTLPSEITIPREGSLPAKMATFGAAGAAYGMVGGGFAGALAGGLTGVGAAAVSDDAVLDAMGLPEGFEITINPRTLTFFTGGSGSIDEQMWMQWLPGAGPMITVPLQTLQEVLPSVYPVHRLPGLSFSRPGQPWHNSIDKMVYGITGWFDYATGGEGEGITLPRPFGKDEDVRKRFIINTYRMAMERYLHAAREGEPVERPTIDAVLRDVASQEMLNGFFSFISPMGFKAEDKDLSDYLDVELEFFEKRDEIERAATEEQRKELRKQLMTITSKNMTFALVQRYFDGTNEEQDKLLRKHPEILPFVTGSYTVDEFDGIPLTQGEFWDRFAAGDRDVLDLPDFEEKIVNKISGVSKRRGAIAIDKALAKREKYWAKFCKDNGVTTDSEYYAQLRGMFEAGVDLFEGKGLYDVRVPVSELPEEVTTGWTVSNGTIALKTVLGSEWGMTEYEHIASKKPGIGESAVIFAQHLERLPFGKTFLESTRSYDEYIQKSLAMRARTRQGLIDAAMMRHTRLNDLNLAQMGLNPTPKIVKTQMKINKLWAFIDWVEDKYDIAPMSNEWKAMNKVGMTYQDRLVNENDEMKALFSGGVGNRMMEFGLARPGYSMPQYSPYEEGGAERAKRDWRLFKIVEGDFTKMVEKGQMSIGDFALKYYNTLSPQMQLNFDEMLRAYAWRLMLEAGMESNKKLGSAYNKWTGTRGFSPESKTMGQKEARKLLELYRKLKRELSYGPSQHMFITEWEAYDANSSIINKLIDWKY